MGWFVRISFFFKQKTAYDMRISDWSSDVCSSDLLSSFYITLEVQVLDEDRVFNRATASYLAEDPHHTEDEARVLFEDDLGACLVQLVDPGSLPGAAIIEVFSEAF